MKLISASTRASFARTLESQGAEWPGAALLASAYGVISRRGVCRPLAIPKQARGIGVGGATLGGSGKTPVAIAIARALAERGERVAFVGHAYRARPRFARIVTSADDIRAVGDEALLAVRTLSRFDVEVIVSSTRQTAVNFAARRAKYLVIDGLLQTQPYRLAHSVLTLDGQSPWGNARFPPSGDLRAPRDALLTAADVVALVRDELVSPPPSAIGAGGKCTFEVLTRTDRVRDPDGREIALGDLGARRLGLLLSVARPRRVTDTLALRGIHPLATIMLADHDPPTRADLARAIAAAPPVDAWLTTAKCATQLPARFGGNPVFVLDYEVALPEALISSLVSALIAR